MQTGRIPSQVRLDPCSAQPTFPATSALTSQPCLHSLLLPPVLHLLPSVLVELPQTVNMGRDGRGVGHTYIRAAGRAVRAMPGCGAWAAAAAAPAASGGGP